MDTIPNDKTLVDTLRQMMADWNAATPEQRAEFSRLSALAAQQAHERVLARHRRRDPHCTCNDCMAYYVGNGTEYYDLPRQNRVKET